MSYSACDFYDEVAAAMRAASFPVPSDTHPAGDGGLTGADAVRAARLILHAGRAARALAECGELLERVDDRRAKAAARNARHLSRLIERERKGPRHA